MTMATTMYFIYLFFISVILYLNLFPTIASAYPRPNLGLAARQTTAQPTFPATPPSCPICEQNYTNIDSCAHAAPVLANFTSVLFNPGAFLSVIKCACTDTFQAAFPQCVDCFEKTNQTDVLPVDEADLPAVLNGVRQVCAVSSSILGNASNMNGETTPSISAPASAPSANAGSRIVAGEVALALALIAVVAAVIV